jgi:hypothetical protein
LVEENLAHEFIREILRGLEGERKAQARSEALGLVERGVILLIAVVCLGYALIDNSHLPPVPVLGGGVIALISRWRCP